MPGKAIVGQAREKGPLVFVRGGTPTSDSTLLLVSLGANATLAHNSLLFLLISSHVAQSPLGFEKGSNEPRIP
jgi:hypothetical protein